MHGTKADIVARLQQEIILLQRSVAVQQSPVLDIMIGPIKNAFPGNTFALGVIHEFIATGLEDAAATGGFVSSLMSGLMKKEGVAIWVGSNRSIFPPALKAFGITPDKVIFIDLHREKEIQWAMEEALKCNAVAAVVGEMQELSFTASRRFQLAVEESGVTGFIVRRNPRKLEANACVTRWEIHSLPSIAADDLPGVGFPRLQIKLLKVRNGKPGTWEVEWVAGRFKPVQHKNIFIAAQQKKVG